MQFKVNGIRKKTKTRKIVWESRRDAKFGYFFGAKSWGVHQAVNEIHRSFRSRCWSSRAAGRKTWCGRRPKLPPFPFRRRPRNCSRWRSDTPGRRFSTALQNNDFFARGKCELARNYFVSSRAVIYTLLFLAALVYGCILILFTVTVLVDIMSIVRWLLIKLNIIKGEVSGNLLQKIINFWK